MSSIHQDLLSNYEPVILIQQNIKLLSNVLTKYQDCKFYVVGFELKGDYINSEIIKNLDKLNSSQVKELLDNINFYDKELFNSAKKVFTNTASKEEFYDYVKKLKKTLLAIQLGMFNDAQN